MDPHPDGDIDAVLVVQFGAGDLHPLDQAQAGQHRPPGVVLVDVGVAEAGNDPVTLELQDAAVELLGGRGAAPRYRVKTSCMISGSVTSARSVDRTMSEKIRVTNARCPVESDCSARARASSSAARRLSGSAASTSSASPVTRPHAPLEEAASMDATTGR